MLTRPVDRARASFRAGLSRTGVVGPSRRSRSRPRSTTHLPHRLPDGTILDEDVSENWWGNLTNIAFYLKMHSIRSPWPPWLSYMYQKNLYMYIKFSLSESSKVRRFLVISLWAYLEIIKNKSSSPILRKQ